MIALSPEIVAALVQRHHGQVIITMDEVAEAERLAIKVVVNERGELVITTREIETKASR